MSDLSSQRLEVTPEERQAKLERQVRDRFVLPCTLFACLQPLKTRGLKKVVVYRLCRSN